ncbi:hypothetical protein HY495_02470 [Candidatus Woesearchaeota archaeon]|nr:hypothetical protein [Candidatus Woesearchaeota archaeon]
MDSPDLAYWVGVIQTDGYFKKQFVKSEGVTRYLIRLNVGYSSIEMLDKFRSLSQLLFSIKGNTWHNTKRNDITFQFGAKNLMGLFSSLDIDFSDPPKPPLWILGRKEFFGAYLAGVIDGDGDVSIRRPIYPQCAVRINSGSPCNALALGIQQFMNVGVSIHFKSNISFLNGRKIMGSGYVLEFYISPKNFCFFLEYVLKEMAITRKSLKIKGYVLTRMSSHPKIFK